MEQPRGSGGTGGAAAHRERVAASRGGDPLELDTAACQSFGYCVLMKALSVPESTSFSLNTVPSVVHSFGKK